MTIYNDNQVGDYGLINEFDQFEIGDMIDISKMFDIPHKYFTSGLAPAFVYKFEPNIVVKMYMDDKNQHYQILVYKKKLLLREYKIPYYDIYRFVKEQLNCYIKELIKDSCISEYQDGFNT